MTKPTTAALLGLVLLLAPAPAASAELAQAEPERAARVVIVVVDRIRVVDFLGIPAVRRLAGSAAFGVISTAGRGVVTPYMGALSISAGTRAVTPSPADFFLTVAPGPVTERLLAGTVGDAYRARTGREPPSALERRGTPVVYPDIDAVRRASAAADVRADPGLLGQAIEDAGLRRSVAMLDPLAARLAPLVAMDESGVVPFGVVMDRRDPARAGDAFARALEAGDLVTVDVGGVAQATTLIPQVLRRLGPEDALIILAADPPRDVSQRHTWLSPVLARGPGLERGLLTSSSTRRDGVVSNVDVVPTVLGWLGVETPAGLVGQTFRSTPAADPVAATSGAYDVFARLAEHRGEVFRASSLLAILSMVAAAAVASRRRRTGRAPFAVRAGLLSAASGPLVMLLLPPAALTGAAASVVWVLAGSLVAGTALAAVVRRDRWGFAAIGGACLAILFFDVLLGSPVGARSLLGFTVAGGTRFYGLASEEMGVVLAGLFLVLGLVVDARPGRRRIAYAGAVVLVLAFAAPPFGAKFGMVLTAVPSLAVAWTVFEGRRLTRELVLLTVAVTIAGIGLAAAAGVLAGSGGSHIGVETRVIGESGPAAALSVVLRRAGVSLRLLGSFWVWLVAAGSATVLFAALLRRDRLRAALTGRPGLRGTLAGLTVAAVASLLFNDAGAVIVATMTLVAGPAAMAELASAPPPPASPQAAGPVSTRRRSSSRATRSPSTIGAST